jgi:hypothetical protein
MTDSTTNVAPLPHVEQLLTPLRESVIDKPPFTSGSLQLPTPYLSLFYIITREHPTARFVAPVLESCFTDFEYPRHVNFVNATFDELEQLAQACDPATFGLNKEDVMDETYRKAGKMDSDCFSTSLVPYDTDLIKIVRDYLLEGTDSTRKIKVELYKLNVYSMCVVIIAHSRD